MCWLTLVRCSVYHQDHIVQRARELLAVVTYYYDILHTDHASLVWMKNSKDADGMFARWLVKLEDNFDTVHSAGKSYGKADGLPGCHVVLVNKHLSPNPYLLFERHITDL